MANINVELHLKRYANTDLSDIVKLISGLTNLVEERKGNTINKLKEQLALLEQGQIPEEPARVIPTRKPRSKKITASADEEQDA